MTSLRVRLLGVIIGVAVIGTALSITLVSREADRALRQQNQADLADNAAIYQALAEWGTAHRDWTNADELIGALSRQYAVRIALTDLRGKLLVDSDESTGHPRRELPSSPNARVDPWLPSVSSLRPNDADNPASAEPVVPPVPDPRAVRNCLHERGLQTVWHDGTVDTVLQNWRAWTAMQRCTKQVADDSSAPVALLFLGSNPRLAGPFEGPALPRTLGLVAAILVLAALVGWWLGRRLTRPLADLANTAAQLGAGDLDVRARVQGSDEVGRVGAALNSLAASLQHTEQLRRQLVSDVAHELGNPVVVIGGTLEAIQDGIYPASSEVIDSLSEEVAQLRTLVGDLAELTRADSDGLTLNRTLIELDALCASVVDAARPVAHRHGISLDQATPQPGVVVSADPARLRQVLGNLVSNALRHTPPGGSVVLSVAAETAEVAISVRDTGIGIAADDLPMVFERFWRADQARGAATGGSGLGLAIARELALAHGGRITVSSTLGVGTEFVVHLPRAAAPAPAGTTQESRSTAAPMRSSVAVNATRT